MKIFTTKSDLKNYFKELSSKEVTIGFVPTMGALHKGHLSLIEESKKNNGITIATIFVNPTQFDKKEDLEKYPKTIDKDIALLKETGCDVVFTPTVEDIYEGNVSSNSFDFDGLEHEMEGKFREGHFNGVGTIVNAFFHIINPTNAYFGEKDFQQLQIIKKMVEKLHLPINIVGCPIHREANGLAMSSRNERLTSKQREEASIIYKVLQSVKAKLHTESIGNIKLWVEKSFENHSSFKLEYFNIADEATLKEITEIKPKRSYRAFIAVYTDSIRLIDNLAL